MGPVGHQRIAQRFHVTTTPIEWVVPKRRGLDARSKSVLAEAAIIELSVMGAAIVAPTKWRAVTGSKVQVRWEDHTGLVLVRREVPYGDGARFAMYGVEFADNPSQLGRALFERLVVEPAARNDAAAAAAAAEAVVGGYEPAPMPTGPALWSAPMGWPTESERR